MMLLSYLGDLKLRNGILYLQNKAKLVTYVVASGLTYGAEEHIFHYLFKVSFSLYMILQEDLLCEWVSRILSYLSPYIY